MNSNKLTWLFNKLKNNQEIFTATDMVSTATSTASLAKIIFKLLPFNQNLIVNYSGQDSMSIYDFSLLVSNITITSGIPPMFLIPPKASSNLSLFLEKFNISFLVKALICSFL